MNVKMLFIGLMFVMLTSFASHAFYVSIYQIRYQSKQQALHITSRIFADDLNEALEKKYRRKCTLGEKNESAEDIAMMQQYLLAHFSIKINGKPQAMQYINRDIENNVVICYFTAKAPTKIKTLEVRNTALLEMFDDQQNIIQADVSGKKQNLLLMVDQPSGVLKWQ